MERLVEKPGEAAKPCGFSAPVTGMRLRAVRSSDLGEIMVIERASFAYPWSASFFLQELEVACAHSLLALVGEKAVGYIIYWLLPGELDIHNLAVHPTYRRQGIGRTLLHAAIDEARRQSISRATLEVRKSNDAAQKLYQSLGFVVQGVRKGYYSDDGEDAVVMALELEG